MKKTGVIHRLINHATTQKEHIYIYIRFHNQSRDFEVVAEKMAQSKDDIKIGTAQARVSEDDALRIRYKAGTPLEGGKIAESEPVDLFSSAHNIQRATQQQEEAETGLLPSNRCKVMLVAAAAARKPRPELLNKWLTESVVVLDLLCNFEFLFECKING